MTRSVYIGNAFIDSQLLFIIPFVHGYASEKGIKMLVFERPLSNMVKSHPVIANILINYTVVEESIFYGLRRYCDLLLPLSLSLLPALRLAFKSTRNGLLDNVPWYETQLRHAVWDQALQGSNDGSIELSLKRRFIEALRVILSIRKANHIHCKYRVVTAVLGHTVYLGRAILAVFRLKDIDILLHSGCVLHRTKPDRDSSYLCMSHTDWQTLSQMTNTDQVYAYWNSRLEGKSTYLDAQNAAKSTNLVTLDTPKNVLFLHIFRDSPFNHIDRTRIFSDYIHWILETFKILSLSDENWLIKTHPSSLRWGEDQSVWLQSIGYKVFGEAWPPNIEIDSSDYSNIDLLLNAKRVVTYRGTVHLEAACLGIKPIIISEVSLSSFKKSLVHKPVSLSEYKSLLLCSQDSSIFRLAEPDITVSKRLLFIREMLLSFGRDVGFLSVYRGDPVSQIEANFNSVSSNVAKFSPSISRLGHAMARGLERSVRLDYFDKWCYLNLSEQAKDV